jgi:ketosteroid isomerase-like protein
VGGLWKIAIPFVVVMLAGLGLILWLAGGEEAAIRDLYRGYLEAGRAHDAERLVEAVSTRYNYQEIDYERMVERIRSEVKPGRYADVEEIDSPSVSVVGDGATIDAHLRVRMTDLPVPVPLRVRVHLRRESKGWKIIGVEVRHRRGSEE